MGEKLLLIFDSVAFAMRTESVLKEEQIDFKTIPTPRVISSSCGLSILTDLNEENRLKSLVEEKNIPIAKFYKFTRGEKEKAVEL